MSLAFQKASISNWTAHCPISVHCPHLGHHTCGVWLHWTDASMHLWIYMLVYDSLYMNDNMRLYKYPTGPQEKSTLLAIFIRWWPSNQIVVASQGAQIHIEGTFLLRVPRVLSVQRRVLSAVWKLTVLSQQWMSALLQRRVQTPTARLIFPRRMEGLLVQ